MSTFTQTRSTVIKSDPANVHALLDNFHRWEGWSPWEKRDPDLKRTYSGPESGVGAKYAWQGNRQVGSGRMEITGSTPSRVDIDLQFLKPFKASNKTIFELAPDAAGTKLSWTMTGERNLLFTLLGKLFFDKEILKDFDNGLAAIKKLAEQ